MAESRTTTHRHGVNIRQQDRLVPKSDEPDFVDKQAESIEFCSVPQFERRMATQYADWQSFIRWMEDRNGQ